MKHKPAVYSPEYNPQEVLAHIEVWENHYKGNVSIHATFISARALHVTFHRYNKQIFAHWYPSRGRLYIGQFAEKDFCVEGEYYHLLDVLQKLDSQPKDKHDRHSLQPL